MQSGAIKHDQLIASSERGHNHKAHHGRLHLKATWKGKSWRPHHNGQNHWLQIYLRSELTWVTGVATQGREGKRSWVTKYKLRYWGAGVNVQFYKDQGENEAKVN